MPSVIGLSALPAIAGITAFILAAIILYDPNRSSANRLSRWYFAYFSIAMGAWAVLISVYINSPDSSIAHWVVRFYYIAAAALVHGFVLFCRQLEPSLHTIDTKGLGAAFAFICLLAFTPGLLLDFNQANEVGLNMAPYMLYSIYFMATYVIAMIMLRAAYKLSANKTKRLQRSALLLATGIAFPAGAFFNLILPALGNYDLIAIGPLFVFPIVLIVGYSMLKHGLFDVRQATVRSVGYVASLVSFVGVYFTAAYLISVLVLGSDTTNATMTNPVSIMLALLLAVLFQPIKGFFDRATDRIFFRDRYNPAEFIAELGDILTSTTQLKSLLNKSLDHVTGMLKSSYGVFVVTQDDKPPTIVSTNERRRYSDAELDILDGLTKTARGRIVLASDITENQVDVNRVFSKHKIAILIPLAHAKNSVGFLILGEHKAGVYSKRDISVLNSIKNELIIAIQNARSLQALRDFNIHLQQSIETATKELRQSNNKLRKLDEAKDEFVSMASHQLRTPLTSIKGYISMVLDGDVGKITPQQRKLLGEAFTSSERMVRLISDFLNVSRIQTGKFMIDSHEVYFKALVAEEVEAMQQIAASHGMKIQYVHPKIVPHVVVDEDKTRQVIMNFIDNAIYYSPGATTITVKLKVDSKSVTLEVHDKGIGVPKNKQDRLFTKFFRADNARKQRPDGTGIGLYLAKKVIEAQGGEIIFHSHISLGSVFGFKLPVNRK